MIYNLRITNGSLNKRLEEVELNKHQFEEIRSYQEGLRRGDLGRIEELVREIQGKNEVIRGM